MMKRTKAWLAILIAALACGCQEQPGPRLVGGSGDQRAEMEGDGRAAGAGEVESEKSEVGTAPDILEVGGSPDALYEDAVPGIPEGGPLLVPRVFIGASSGGEFTLMPIATPGLSEGTVMTGGPWEFWSWHGGVQ